MLTKVFGSAVFGVEVTAITVKVNVDDEIGYHLVGLPDNFIKVIDYWKEDKHYRTWTGQQVDAPLRHRL